MIFFSSLLDKEKSKYFENDSLIFDEFKNQTISFSYFQADQKYYLFFYSQKSIDIDLIDPFIHILQELDTKQRQIRSFRGFFLYALEIMETGKDYEILETNLQPFFWRKVKNIIRQNKKAVLLEFLLGSQESRGYSSIGSIPSHFVHTLEEKIQTLQD